MKIKKTIDETGYGWITPSGKIFATPSYYHLDGEVLAAMDGVPDFSAIEEHMQGVHDGCQAQADIEGDTHAEWHSYDVAQDNARSEKYGLMMSAGFIRVGVRSQSREDWVYFQGTSKARASLGQAIVRVTTMFGRGLSAFKYEEWKI